MKSTPAFSFTWSAGVTAGRYLEIELVLQAERTSFTEVITPRIRSVQQQVVCGSQYYDGYRTRTAPRC